MKNKNSIHHVPYLRNSMAYDHDFWYTCVKWWYLRCFFGLWSKRTKNGPKWQKILSVSLLISGTLHHIWLCFLIHMCKIMISPAIFFIFSKLFFFLVFQKDKRAKNDPKLLPTSVHHALYLRKCRSLSRFLVCRCKILSPGVFLYFLKKVQHCKY